MDKKTILSIAAIAIIISLLLIFYANTTILCIVAILTCLIAFSQMKISGAKIKLDLYNKRFAIYIAALDYYQAIWHEPYEKAKEKSISFTKAYRESRFLFDNKSGIYETLGEIQQNGSTILDYEKYKHDSKNNLTEDRHDLSLLHESSLKALNKFAETLKLLEKQLEEYIGFTNIEGWQFPCIKRHLTKIGSLCQR